MTHSPEPWKLAQVDDDDERFTAEDATGHRLESDPYDGVSTEDWTRIVACVNACQGIPTEDLVRMTENQTNEKRILELFRLWTPRLEQAFAAKKKLENL